MAIRTDGTRGAFVTTAGAATRPAARSWTAARRRGRDRPGPRGRSRRSASARAVARRPRRARCVVRARRPRVYPFDRRSAPSARGRRRCAAGVTGPVSAERRPRRPQASRVLAPRSDSLARARARERRLEDTANELHGRAEEQRAESTAGGERSARRSRRRRRRRREKGISSIGESIDPNARPSLSRRAHGTTRRAVAAAFAGTSREDRNHGDDAG